MNIQIRIAQRSDCAMLAEHLREFGNDEPANRRKCKAQEEDEGVLLVAWLEGIPAGRLWIRWAGSHEIPRIRDTYPVAATIEVCPSLDEFEVAKDLRGRGIGSQLINHAEMHVKERGYHQVSLTVEHNSRVRRLYGRLGYSDPDIGVFHTFGTYTDDNGEEVPWDNGQQVFLIKEL